MSTADPLPRPVPTPMREQGMARSILHEIRHALERLVAQGEGTRIELQALPLAPAELAALESVLGRGEVEAHIEALGPTLIRETAIPGVWWVDYRDAEGRRLSYQLEIAFVPEILRPRAEDLAESVARLDERLHAFLAESHHA